MSPKDAFSIDPNTSSGNALDPSNKPSQNPDNQYFISSGTDIQDIQNLIALASRVSLPPARVMIPLPLIATAF